MHRQRKAVESQYSSGAAPGDEAGIFGFFQPIIDKPYDKIEKDKEADKEVEKPPVTVTRELSHREITPPPVVEQEEIQPYRRPIPQRMPLVTAGLAPAPQHGLSPVSPISDSMQPSEVEEEEEEGGGV